MGMGNTMGNTLSGELEFFGTKRRKIDILDNKHTFYVKRDVDKEKGSYFQSSQIKIVCNSNEFYQFYLLAGGVLHFSPESRPREITPKFAQIIKDYEVFGSYVYIEGKDNRLRTLLYTRNKGLRENKSVSSQGTVNSIIPRYDGGSGQVVIGMMIINPAIDSDRRWTRYDDPKHIHENQGFFEMTKLSQINRLTNIVGICEDLYVIYVTKETSLLMIDVTESNLNSNKIHHNTFTLFQEGSVLAFNCKLYFRFCDKEEDEEYDCDSLHKVNKHSLGKFLNLDLLNRDICDVGLRRVFLLRKTRAHTSWTLKVRRVSPGYPLECLLCIPSEGEFENILGWKSGLRIVNRRQNQKPWQNYMESSVLKDKNKFPLNVKFTHCYPLDRDSDSDSDDSEDEDFCGPYI